MKNNIYTYFLPIYEIFILLKQNIFYKSQY